MGCDLHPELVTAAETDLVLTLASQNLDPKFDTSGSKELRATAKRLEDGRAATYDQ